MGNLVLRPALKRNLHPARRRGVNGRLRDRVAANGDVANKIGTYALSLAARRAGIPFVVAVPESTIDAATESGIQIPLERRPEDEVTHVLGVQAAPAGTRAVNYAFDVTPAELVTAIVTEDRLFLPGAAASLLAEQSH